MPLLKVNYIFNECYFKRMSLLIWINATVLEMLLSYFVFHQDKVDSCFCGHMIHPPLSASNCFFFYLWKWDIYSTRCYCDLLLHYAKHFCFKSVLCSSTKMSHRQLCLISTELHKMRLDFLFVLADTYFILSASWKVSTGLHPHDCAVCFEMLCYL
jgi:hypothetical protein